MNIKTGFNKGIKNINKFYRNNYKHLNLILSFLLAIGLIVILYSVYKYYKNGLHNVNNTTIEGFLQQEPYDLLEKIKSNIYKLETKWDNQLYLEQKNKKEFPLSFWELTKQDSNYKVIGHAVNNKVDEYKNNEPVAPKDKTMLVDGDTKTPVDFKLIYHSRDNQVTTKRKNEKGELEFKTEFNNLNSLKELDERLEILKDIYDEIESAKAKFIELLTKKEDSIFKKIDFTVNAYKPNEIFNTSSFNSYITNKQAITLPDGNYHAITFPLGSEVKLVFESGKTLTYKGDLSNVFNKNDMSIKPFKLYDVYRNSYGEGNDFIQLSDFDVFSKNGLTKSDVEFKHLTNVDKETSIIGNSVKVVRRTGPRDDTNRDFVYPFNYYFSENPAFIPASSYGKNYMYDYLNSLIKIKNRNNYFADDTLSKAYYVRVNHSSSTKHPINNSLALFNYDITDKKYIRTEPLFSVENAGSVTYGKRGVPDTLKEGFATYKNIQNGEIREPMISIGKEITETVSYPELLDIFDNLSKKIDRVNNTSWSQRLEGLNELLRFDDISYTNSPYINATRDSLELKMPIFYVNLVFKYPVIRLGGLRSKRSSQIYTAYDGPGSLFSPGDNEDPDRNKRQRNNTKIKFRFREPATYQSTSNNKSIKGQSLKSATIKLNFELSDLPVFNPLRLVRYNKVKNLENIASTIISMTNTLNDLKRIIQSNELLHFPMKIHRPIAPKYYKSLGDLIFTQTSNFDNIDNNFLVEKPNLSEFACVPEQCVREVREWLPIDKIYEYQEGSTYLAIFKNPYLQTFRAVTSPGTLPPGKVEKIVACVERCKLVDDIIQADKCARTFYKTHKNINETYNLDPDAIINERKNNIYKNKLSDRQDRINVLKETARRLQIQDDKANIINKEYNRNKLQDLVDKQRINMFKLVDNLEEGKNKIEIRTKFNYDKLNELCSSGNLPDEVCGFVQENIAPIVSNMNANLTDEEQKQFDQTAVQAILDSCPTQDMQNYVKRSLVENNCGCYFTDEELENP